MFKLMYLIFLAFVIVIAVAVNINEIRTRRNAENAFIVEIEAEKAARSEAAVLEGKCVGLMERCNALQRDLKQTTTDNAVLRCRIDEAERARKACAAATGILEKDNCKLINANKALKERNFDDIMSLFECTIGEDGKEYYEMDGICLVVENGKCVGYYRPHGKDMCEREESPSSVSRADTFPQGKACEGYIAPVAETVEA